MSAAESRFHLIDTSVWIPLLRRSPAHPELAQRVTGLISANVAATTGLVRFEILRGARDERHFDQLRTVLDGLHQLPVPENLWEEAAALGLQTRRAGLVTQGSDLLIAAVALRAGAVLLHRDRDFDLIALHSSLKVEGYV